MWPRVARLLFPERQEGDTACKWRENRTEVVAGEAGKEGKGLGTNGRGFGDSSSRLSLMNHPVFHFLSLSTLRIFLSSVLHTASPGISEFFFANLHQM